MIRLSVRLLVRRTFWSATHLLTQHSATCDAPRKVRGTPSAYVVSNRNTNAAMAQNRASGVQDGRAARDGACRLATGPCWPRPHRAPAATTTPDDS